MFLGFYTFYFSFKQASKVKKRDKEKTQLHNKMPAAHRNLKLCLLLSGSRSKSDLGVQISPLPLCHFPFLV
jgi:hypothetical protein